MVTIFNRGYFVIEANAHVPLAGSHFHDWIDHNGAAFSTELLEWGSTYIFGFLR